VLEIDFRAPAGLIFRVIRDIRAIRVIRVIRAIRVIGNSLSRPIRSDL
jgi:hypothetical protein